LKIASGFSSFKADQFKNWITIYCIPALFHILSPEHLECWRHYVLACRILCNQCLSKSDIELAHHLLLHFRTKVECFYDKEVISPNMHGSAHLQEIYGPSQEFWLFSYKRYNGILGKQPTNNKAIKPQLMQRFLRTSSLPCPQEFKEDFTNFKIQDQIIGSVRETLLPTNVQVDKIILPTKCKRTVINITTQGIL